jgi:hypothetical protein
MRVFVVEVGLPESWSKLDVLDAVNIGLTRHHAEERERKLDSPAGLASYVHCLSQIVTPEVE